MNADYVLSGVYSSDGNDIVVDAELAEAKSGRILWTERFKDKVSGILSEEQELISRLIAEVGAAVMSRELQRSMSQPLPTLKAYTLLMGAIALMHRLSLRDFEEAHVIEIKCGESAYKKAEFGEVPVYYYGQLQHILFITGLALINYWCYLPGRKGILISVDRDDDYISDLIEKCEIYKKHLIKD